MRYTVLPILALLVVGCSNKDPVTGEPKLATPGETDRSWAAQAYQQNLFQIEAGRLATSRAVTDRVRNLARMMLRDYSELGAQLETHAQQHNISLPGEMDPDRATYLEKLAAVPQGPDFDRSYLNLSLRTHYQLIDLYESEANTGEFPGTRAVAQQQLPALYARQRHIEQLRPGTWTSPAKPTGDERHAQPAGSAAK